MIWQSDHITSMTWRGCMSLFGATRTSDKPSNCQSSVRPRLPRDLQQSSTYDLQTSMKKVVIITSWLRALPGLRRERLNNIVMREYFISKNKSCFWCYILTLERFWSHIDSCDWRYGVEVPALKFLFLRERFDWVLSVQIPKIKSILVAKSMYSSLPIEITYISRFAWHICVVYRLDNSPSN